MPKALKSQFFPMPRGVPSFIDDSRTIVSAFTQGSRAWLKGRGRDSNPHENEDLQAAWNKGWDEAHNRHI